MKLPCISVWLKCLLESTKEIKNVWVNSHGVKEPRRKQVTKTCCEDKKYKKQNKKNADN